MDKHAELGRRIKEAIDYSGKNQSDIARELDVEPSHLSRWIKGRVAPSYEILVKIGNLTGVSLDKLIANKEALTPMPEFQELVKKLLYILDHGDQDSKDIIRGDLAREYRRLKEMERAEKLPPKEPEKKGEQ